MRGVSKEYFSTAQQSQNAPQKNPSNWPDTPMTEAQLLAILHERQMQLHEMERRLVQTQDLLRPAQQGSDGYFIEQSKRKEKELLEQLNECRRREEAERSRNQEMMVEMEKWKNKSLLQDGRNVRSSSVKKVQFSSRERTEMQDKMKEMKKQLEDRERELKKLNNYCEQAEIGLKEETSRAACYEETVTSYQEKIALFSQETWRLNEVINKVRKELGQKNAKIAAFESLEQEIMISNERLKVVNSVIESRMQDIQEMKQSIENYCSVQQRNNQMMQEMSELEHAYNTKIQQCQQMHEHICTLSEQIMGLEQTIQTMRFDAREEQGKHKEMCKAIEIDKEHMRMSYEALLQSKDKEQTEALRQILKCKETLERIEKKHDKINERIDDLKDLVRALKEDYVNRLDDMKESEKRQQELMNNYSKMEISVHNLVERFTDTKELENAFIKSLKYCKIQAENESEIFDHKEIEQATHFMKQPLFTVNKNIKREKNIQDNGQRQNQVRNSRDGNNGYMQQRFCNSYDANIQGVNLYNMQYQRENNKMINQMQILGQVPNDRFLQRQSPTVLYNVKNSGEKQFYPVSQKTINYPKQINPPYPKVNIGSQREINPMYPSGIMTNASNILQMNLNVVPQSVPQAVLQQRVMVGKDQFPPPDYNRNINGNAHDQNRRRVYDSPAHATEMFFDNRQEGQGHPNSIKQIPYSPNRPDAAQQRLFPIKKGPPPSSFRRDNSLKKDRNSISERMYSPIQVLKSKSPFGLSKNY